MELGIILKSLVVLLAIHDLLSIIVRLTKTPKDDDINNKFGKVLNLLFSASNNIVSSKELQERVNGIAALRALETVRDKAVCTKQLTDVDNIISESAKSTARRIDLGMDLIPDMPMTVPGKIGTIISKTVKNKNMKTKLGKNIQNLFRRID